MGEGGSKIGKIMRTYFMNGPILKLTLEFEIEFHRFIPLF